MVSIGNKSKLASNEICQGCGRCCTTFSWTDTADQGLRFSWMGDKDIVVEDTDLKFPDGEDIKVISINRSCKMLEKKDGKYYCKAYNSKRPDFCNTYPDNIFKDIRRYQRKEIQKAIDFEKLHCPIFEKLTADDVIRKLYKPKLPKRKLMKYGSRKD